MVETGIVDAGSSVMRQAKEDTQRDVVKLGESVGLTCQRSR